MNRETFPKLIVVDGLSGSGKTTTCQWLERQLRQRAISTRSFYEADIPHPLHWWNYWDGVRHRAPDFESISPAVYMAASIEKWNDFAITVSGSEDIFIVEGVIFCLGMGFFLQGDAQPDRILTYARHVETIVKALAPLLIYLRQADVAAHTRKVWDGRGRAIEEELIGNLERTPYLRRRNLKGFDGVVTWWEETQRLTDALFSEYTIPKMLIEVTAGNWDDYYRQIFAALPLGA